MHSLKTIGHGFHRGFLIPHFHGFAWRPCLAEIHGHGGGHGGGIGLLAVIAVVILVAVLATSQNKGKA